MSKQSPGSIVVVQHCQSEHHINGMTGGWTDTPLTQLGRTQAERVARRIATEFNSTNCKLYTSDLLRASQTAEYISRAIGITAISEPALREFNTGIAAGMTRIEAAKIEAPMPPDGPGIDRQPYPEAETWRKFYWRVAGFLDRLIDLPESTTPILVSHGGTVVNIITWWLGIDVEKLSDMSFESSPGGITYLSSFQWSSRTLRSLKKLSDMSHLA